MTLILENREFSGFEIDDDFEVRLASNMTADGGTEIFRPAENKSWEPFLKIEMEDALTCIPKRVLFWLKTPNRTSRA
jgi:hypothetical protein